MRAHSRHVVRHIILTGLAACLATLGIEAGEQTVRFYDDDPLAIDRDTEDASGVESRDVDLLYEFIESLFLKPGGPGGPALNTNTIDEVPDSSWFTNRIVAHELSVEDVARGPEPTAGPRPGPWRVERGKTEGIMPGLQVLDPAGDRYFVKFDTPGYGELATGAEVVVTKLFHALGYHVPANHIAYIERENLVVGEGARVDYDDGRRRPLTAEDIDRVLDRAAREPDGTYRVVASRALEGRPVGGFRFHGTRPDDPNDIVPHESRRELRALRVFSAWLNHVDCKGSNTLDTIVDAPAGPIVRHHLLDFGSTLGSGGVFAREPWEGAEFIYDGSQTASRLWDFGVPTRPWMHARYPDLEAVGRFEAETFAAETWKPRIPNPAFERAEPADLFWGARRVAAFTDRQIRAAVESGRYTDPRTVAHLTETLIARRDEIARTWLTVVNPIVDLTLANGVLTFDNAAVRAGVAEAPAGYAATWYTFDNATGTAEPWRDTPHSVAETTRIDAPRALPTARDRLIRVDVRAVDPPHASWDEPVRAYFRGTADGWTLVGLERGARGR